MICDGHIRRMGGFFGPHVRQGGSVFADLAMRSKSFLNHAIILN